MATAGTMANTPRVRTRQGCLTCRKRRRKCDERKPECQNCIGRKLQCRYGVNLTFLAANTFGLLPEDAKTLQDSAPATYQSLRFVDGSEETELELENKSEQFEDASISGITAIGNRPHSDEGQSEAHGQTPIGDRGYVVSPNTWTAVIGNQSNDNQTDNLAPLNDSAMEDAPDLIHHSQRTLSSASDPPFASVPRENSGRNKIHRHSSATTFSFQALSPQISLFGSPQALMQSRVITGPRQETPQSPVLERPSPASQSSSLREPVIIFQPKDGLIKYYIDEVAPWIDVCAPRFSYGTHLPILATKNIPLYNSILAIAACQKGLVFGASPELRGNELSSIAMNALGSDFYSRREESMAARGLLKVIDIISRPMAGWRAALQDQIEFLRAMDIHGYVEDHRGALWWLILRFDLAISIISESPILTILADSPRSNIEEETQIQKTASIAQDALLLCCRAANLHFSTQSSSQSNELTFSNLQPTLQAWQAELPPLMQPILLSLIGGVTESSSTSSTFPLLVHMSRTSLFGSILYHLASIFLLQSSPRSLRRTNARGFKTATWHAVQICGLSISNIIAWSWDPIVVTALLYAGKLLSYSEQHKELLHHMLALKGMTGWKIDGEIEALQKVWSIAR